MTMMNLRIQLSTLSPWVYFWFVLISLLWCLSFIWMWQYSLSCTLFLIPFLWLIYWWNKNRIHCSLEHILTPFLHGYVNMTGLAIVCQLIGLVIISIFFAATGAISYSFGYLFYLVVSITYYVTVEELLKLYFSLKSRDSLEDPVNQITKVHTITSTATALGYSMCTGTIWTFFMSLALAKDDRKDNEEYNLFGWLFLVTLIIAVIGMPMHLITGYITGCKIAQKDMEWAASHRNEENVVENDSQDRNRLPFRKYVSAVYTNIAVRSGYLFFLIIGFLVIQFSVEGVIISFFGIILDYVLLICHAKKVESQLPFDYLQRAGQLSMFGYNVLADEPNDDERVQFSAPELDEVDLGNAAALDLRDNQVVITAARMDQFAPQMDEPMVVGQHGKGKVQEIVVALDSESEEDNVQKSSPGGGPRLEVPESVLDDSNSNTDEEEE